MERRTAIKSIGGLFLLPGPAMTAPVKTGKRALRIAHITDVHLKNELDAPAKFAKCLHHLQQQNPKVDLVLNGGDIVFDMNKEDIGAINAQWKLYKDLIKTECNLPVQYCLGNHDIWWKEDNRSQAIYGKHFSMDQLQLKSPYYSF